MSMLRRLRSLQSMLSALVILTGASAHAQILRERDLGVNHFDNFGHACANAGDVDNDGIDDFIVGSPYYDSASLTNSGRAVVYSGATGVAIRAHDGAAALDHFGYSVAGLGDIDGDGVSDYVVGAPDYGSYVGEVLFYGGSSGAMLWRTSASAPTLGFGISVSGIGDVDGDGKGDVVIGTSSNEVYVHGYMGSPIHHLTNPNPFGFGYAVAGVGDIDGDGVRDFVVGAPLADLITWTDLGLVGAYSGATGSWLYTIWGSSVGDQLGWMLAPLGDVNGDGFDDYAAGSPWSDTNGNDSGIVRVVSAGGGTIREQSGDVADDLHGWSACGMGDVDRDGVADYAVGAVSGGSGWQGRVRICSGSSGSIIYERYGTLGSNQDLGSSVASGDWNGDGVADLILGDSSYADPVSGNYVGAVEIELMCPAWWSNYGTGWAGKHGAPGLTSQQNPEVGAPLDVVLGNSLGAATTALLLVGTQSTSVATSRDGTLLVIPQLTLVLQVPANGLTLSDTLPNDPILYFLDIYLQALEIDAFATKGLSFTPGLQLHCGFDLP